MVGRSVNQSFVGAIVIPVLDEAGAVLPKGESGFEHFLKELQFIRQQGWKVILVDGGSVDETISLAEPWVDNILRSAPGRSKQMNLGWRSVADSTVSVDVVVFLHADTYLPKDFSRLMQSFFSSHFRWGRFDVRLSGRHIAFRVIEWFMNGRSRLTQVATGDQTLFFKRDFLEQLEGFAEIELMEDVEICKRARLLAEPLCLRQRVITSSRRWEKHGIVRTVWLMWCLRWAYYKGESPLSIRDRYYS